MVLECPRCGGRLEASDDTQLFTCRYCQFDVLLQPGKSISNVAETNSAKQNANETEPPDWLLRLQTRLERLKADRKASKAAVTGFGLGFLINVAMVVGMIWFDAASQSWIPSLVALVCLFLFVITVIGMRAHQKEIQDLENRIAVSKLRR